MRTFKGFVMNYLALTALLTVIAVVVLRLSVPSQYPSLLYLIPLFFILMLGIMLLIRRIMTNKGKSEQMFLLSYRTVRFILLLGFVTVYVVAVREYLLPFVIVFAVFYLVLLIYETLFFVRFFKLSKR